MSLQAFFNNFTLFTDAPNGAAKLRKLILQLAVEGKLDTQNPSDESVSDLLERIKLKRKQLLSERRTNQNETLSQVTDEALDSLPTNWRWVRLGELQLFTNGFAFKSSDYQADGVGIIRIGDISNGEISKAGMRFVSSEFLSTLDSKFQVKKGDLLIAMSGATTGKLGFNKSQDIFLLNQRVGKIEFIEVSPVYGFLFLQTKISENLNSSAGSAIPNLSTEQINNIPFPLPPLEEQKRIVAKVGELMRLCDELEAQQQARRASRVRLNNVVLAPLNNPALLAPEEFERAAGRLADNFDALYDSAQTVGKLRSTILQLAVQGKLVPQNESDESASALLERYYSLPKDNQRLKKRTKDSPIVLSNNLFPALPLTWVYASIQSLYEKNIIIDYADGNHGELYPRKSDFRDDGVIFVTAAQIANGKVQWEKCSKLAESKASKLNKGWARGSDVLLTHNATVGRVAVVANEIAPFLLGTSVTFYRLNERALDKEYFYICLISPIWQTQLSEVMQQTTRNQVSIQKQAFFLIPVPPLEEQKRIVAKVNQLMALCDELETKLRQTEADSEKLMKAAVRDLLVSVGKGEIEEALSSAV